MIESTGEEYILSDDGAIINEKLAKLLGVVKGDEITFKDSENNSYIIKVNNISESYLSHGIYMSKAYYADVFGKELKYNSQFIMLDDNADEDEIFKKLIESDNVINVTLTSN